MKKVLVTGAKGMLGKDLCSALLSKNYKVIAADIDSFDITNYDETKLFFTSSKPDIVIHCAAYTNVNKAEDEENLAMLINHIGTENIAKICSDIKATLVYISTDYIFDGTKNSPYLPTDKANPINIYGLSKYKGEEAVKKHCQKYFIIRTSWLYGLNGKNFVETMISLQNSPSLKVVDDQYGCPTWTKDLADALIKTLEKENYGIYHICGSNYTSWYGFAKKIFELLDIKTSLQPVKTKDYSSRAQRPKYSVMDNNQSCRSWELALIDYIKLRNKDK